MTNELPIKALRYCAEHDGCDYYIAKDCPRESTWVCGADCEQILMRDAADALEAAEKRIAELEEERNKTVTEIFWEERLWWENRCKELEAQIQKWVSAEDHLPEESGEYIVYIQMGTGVEVPDFMGSNDLSYVTSMYFKKGQKFWLDEYDEAYNADLSLVDTVNEFHVTHWMPLPQKSKGEQE